MSTITVKDVPGPFPGDPVSREVMVDVQKRLLNEEEIKSVFADHEDAFTTYHVRLQIIDRIVGGNPKDPKLVEGWLRKNLGIKAEDELRAKLSQHLVDMGVLTTARPSPEELEEAFANMTDEIKTQGFKRSPEGRVLIEERQCKALLKEATNVVFPPGTKKFGQYENAKGNMVGGKNARSFLAERVFCSPERIVIADEISGVDLSIGHITDWTGETRSTIGYFEYVEQPEVAFTVKVLGDCIKPDEWREIWQLAEENGLGTMRSQGNGKFKVTAWDRM